MSDDLDRRLGDAERSEDVDDLVDLGCTLAELDRQVDAERCFRRATALGSTTATFDLGNTLMALGRHGEAIDAYRAAAAGGESDAWFNLGRALLDAGDRDEAARSFDAAVDAGDAKGAVALAFLLQGGGDQGAADDMLRAVADADNALAAAVQACWSWDRTADAALEPALRAGADHFPSARADLAALLRSTDREDEARRVLERGVELGEVDSYLLSAISMPRPATRSLHALPTWLASRRATTTATTTWPSCCWSWGTRPARRSTS